MDKLYSLVQRQHSTVSFLSLRPYVRGCLRPTSNEEQLLLQGMEFCGNGVLTAVLMKIKVSETLCLID